MDAPTYLHLPAGHPPPELEQYRPFKAVLVVQQPTDEAWRAAVSDALVAGGCLYLMAWGLDCERWHDAVDMALLSAFDFGEVPDEAHIMTTWHDDEPLSDVFWFAGHAAAHAQCELQRTLILDISATCRESEMGEAFRQAYVVAAP